MHFLYKNVSPLFLKKEW